MKTKIKIIQALLEHDRAMTIKEISKTIKSDYRITHIAIQRLLQDKLIVSSKVGQAILCSLNSNYYGIETVLAENARTSEVLKNKNISKLRADILNTLDTSLYILVLQKGLVQGINLLFISNDIDFSQKVKQVIDSIPLQVNYSIMNEKQFKELGHDHTKNIVLHNLDSYYLLKR